VPGGGRLESTVLDVANDSFIVTLVYPGPIRIYFRKIGTPPAWDDPRYAAKATFSTVRGKPGVFLDPSNTGGERIIHWLETPDVQVTIRDVNARFSNDDLIRMVESMSV
jgi:hypothetical protein